MTKGFILSAQWKDSPRHRLMLTVVGERESFIIEFDGIQPLFFIEGDKNPRELEQVKRKTLELQSLQGKPVQALYFNSQRQLLEMKDSLRAQGIRTYESDIRPYERFLMERFIFGGVQIEGNHEVVNGHKIFKNPRLIPCDFWPTFRVLSLDIETGIKGDIYSIGMHLFSRDVEEKVVLMVGEKGEDATAFKLEYYRDEKTLLKRFISLFRQLNADIIIGWHVIGFDLQFIQKRCQLLNIRFELGRNSELGFIESRKNGSWFADIPGRVVLDGPATLRSAFYQFESFKLDFVAQQILGTGKDIEESGHQKVQEIERRFKEDKLALATYNMQDCILVSDIFKETQLIELCVTRTKISGMLLNRLGSSTGAFDFFFLPLLHRKGYVAGDILDVELLEHAAGGHVLEPKAGLHQDVIVLDFKSLYPSIIRTFKIDPYSLIKANENSLKTPPGISFSQTEHILPGQIEKLMEKRMMAKKENNKALSQAIKILMNSFYGVMGSSRCRFYHKNLPTAITETGHWILKTSIHFFEQEGFEVIYGDTDSVFLKMPVEKSYDIDKKAQKLAKEAELFLARKIKNSFGIKSYLELEYEKHFSKFFLPSLRHGEGGAKKRYAGLLKTKQGGELYFAGLEVVRSDWTLLAKNFQRELFRRLFYGENIESWIKDFVLNLKNGQFDNLLVYKKKLTKPLEEYTRSKPPHVKAATLLQEQGLLSSRNIEYVMTRRGPIPMEMEHGDVDYSHYLDKQIRPLADMVLPLMDLRFDDLISGNQLLLF